MKYDDNGNVRVTVDAASSAFDQTVDRVSKQGQRIVLTRRGKGVAVLVTMAELRALEKLEDDFDAKVAARRLRDLRSGKTKAIPWEKVRAELAHRRKQN